jgi:hypothetical protein
MGKYYYKMRPSSLWVSLDFEWIISLIPSETRLLSNEIQIYQTVYLLVN